MYARRISSHSSLFEYEALLHQSYPLFQLVHLTDIVELFCRKANTGLRSQNYINNLDHHFLSALQNVTRLAIIGHEQGAIGQTMFHEAVIPFRKERVPKLKELELGYYFIQDDLLDFLIAHSSTLEVWKPRVISTSFCSSS